MSTDTLPTEDQVAAAKAVLARAAIAGADAPRAALIGLVTMPEYGKVADAAREALMLSPGNVELGYVLSMMERLRATHAPA